MILYGILITRSFIRGNFAICFALLRYSFTATPVFSEAPAGDALSVVVKIVLIPRSSGHLISEIVSVGIITQGKKNLQLYLAVFVRHVIPATITGSYAIGTIIQGGSMKVVPVVK